MNNTVHKGFVRRVGCERAMVMLPFNVVLAARVRGSVDPAAVTAALSRLRLKHPLLGVRMSMEDDGSASFVSDNVPDISVSVARRDHDEHWTAQVPHELRTSFSLTTGPLVRCSLLHAPDVTDIILCAHHAICDGMSLGYLLRDLLQLIAEPGSGTGETLVPPPVDADNVPTPPRTRPLMRFVMSLMNKKWASKSIRFDEDTMQAMHRTFWERNGAPRVQAWSLDTDATSALVAKCRKEGVTVNAALWTAFLTAQEQVQTDHKGYRNRSAMAVSNRDRLLNPAGESFGFFASSLTVKLWCDSHAGFWDNARSVHAAINKEIGKTNLFRMLISDEIHPTLLDSLYFQKYGMLDEKMAAKFLKKMGWHTVTYGTALTNVGRFDIPLQYGPLAIESVHGPLFYSDIEEKMIGVITVGGNLSFLMGSSKAMSDTAENIKDTAMSYLRKAIN